MRNFILRDEDGNEHGVFAGKQPRQAALKAANRGNGTKKNPETICLRERGTKKVHVFKGWREQKLLRIDLNGCLKRSGSRL